MDQTIQVNHCGGDRFDITARGHHLQVDQPTADGGTGAAPTPTDLFVASMASCVAFYCRRFLVRHRMCDQGLRVTAEFSLAERPARVGQIRLSIRLPGPVPAERRAALLAVASHCTVHNSLERPPAVSIALDAGD